MARKTGQAKDLQKYDRAKVVDEVCGILATTSRSLNSICRDPGMPHVNMFIRWLHADENLMRMYVKARENQADAIFDEIIEIADGLRPVDDAKAIEEQLIEDGMTEKEAKHFLERMAPNVVQRDRLRVSARQWATSKLKPGTYGDKIPAGPAGGGVKVTIEINIG